MKNKKHTDIRTNSSGLSPKFWELAHALTGGWEMMNQLLEKEWQILRDRKLASIWNIGRHKEKLASQLKAIEQRIDVEIPGLEPGCKDPDLRWKKILDAALPSERPRLIDWKTQLSNSKKKAFVTNRRLWVWISEQQEMNRQLADILSGRKRQQEALTYDASADFKSSAGSSLASGGFTADEELREEGCFFQGFSRQRANRAMQAYRRANGRQEMLE